MTTLYGLGDSSQPRFGSFSSIGHLVCRDAETGQAIVIRLVEVQEQARFSHSPVQLARLTGDVAMVNVREEHSLPGDELLVQRAVHRNEYYHECEYERKAGLA